MRQILEALQDGFTCPYRLAAPHCRLQPPQCQPFVLYIRCQLESVVKKNISCPSDGLPPMRLCPNLEHILNSSVSLMVFGPPDPLWCVKIVHPEFTTEDLRKLSEAPRAEGAGVFPDIVGTVKERFESITVWNPQCENYAFEVRWSLWITKTKMN